MTRFQDRVALVTGAGSGFGEGIARRFAAEGAMVVVVDLDADRGRRVTDSIAAGGGRSIFVQADVSTPEGAASMVHAATKEFGRIDVLVNNAGVPQRPSFFADVLPADFDRLFAVNTRSIQVCVAAAFPQFKKQGGGVVVNTTSIGGTRPRPGLAAYAASKAAAVALTKVLALELAPFGVRVNSVAPVAGDTPMLQEFMGGEESMEKREAYISSVPLGRLSTPADVAAAVLFLSSDDASLITGVDLAVDGGRGV